MNQFELVTLRSGVKSLRALSNRETFHPVTGPKIEANVLHVNQQRIVERASQSTKFIIWDVGFGAAANAVAAVESLYGCDANVEIHSFDKTTGPIEFALTHAEELGYLAAHQTVLHSLVRDKKVELRPNFTWHLHLGDFGEQLKHNHALPAPDTIFYDPYSPTYNPEMWALEHFKLLRARLTQDKPFLLTNYTRSTAVRVTLLLAGFYVGRGCAVGEKVETTIVSNQLELLSKPLDERWIKTVLISGNAAPLSAEIQPLAPISADDLARVKACPQFL